MLKGLHEWIYFIVYGIICCYIYTAWLMSNYEWNSDIFIFFHGVVVLTALFPIAISVHILTTDTPRTIALKFTNISGLALLSSVYSTVIIQAYANKNEIEQGDGFNLFLQQCIVYHVLILIYVGYVWSHQLNRSRVLDMLCDWMCDISYYYAYVGFMCSIAVDISAILAINYNVDGLIYVLQLFQYQMVQTTDNNRIDVLFCRFSDLLSMDGAAAPISTLPPALVIWLVVAGIGVSLESLYELGSYYSAYTRQGYQPIGSESHAPGTSHSSHQTQERLSKIQELLSKPLAHPINRQQKTFTYPDNTSSFNHFDPDMLPIWQEGATGISAGGVAPHNNKGNYVECIQSTHAIAHYLQLQFGFQIDSARNQAEHLSMMMFNEISELLGRESWNQGSRSGVGKAATKRHWEVAAKSLHRKLFNNYKMWCERMKETSDLSAVPIGGRSALTGPLFLVDHLQYSTSACVNEGASNGDGCCAYDEAVDNEDDAGSVKNKPYLSDTAYHTLLMEDMLLFLLIWGEAANIRHIPECLCYIYHKTMYVHIFHTVQQKEQNRIKHPPDTSKRSSSACVYTSNSAMQHYPGYYLDMVITPLYEVIVKGNPCNGSTGGSRHKMNYDDYNEFFWGSGGSTGPDSDSYGTGDAMVGLVGYGSNLLLYHYYVWEEEKLVPRGPDVEMIHISDGLKHHAGKTFLEKRSWGHALYSFHRILEWHLLSFFVLSVLAFSISLNWSTYYTLRIMSAIFLIANILQIYWILFELWCKYPNVYCSFVMKAGVLWRLSTGFIFLMLQLAYFQKSFEYLLDSDDGGLSASLTVTKVHMNLQFPDPSNACLDNRGCIVFTQVTSAMSDEGQDGNYWWWQYIYVSIGCLCIYLLDSVMGSIFPNTVTRLLNTTSTVSASGGLGFSKLFQLWKIVTNMYYPQSENYVGKDLTVCSVHTISNQSQAYGEEKLDLDLVSDTHKMGYTPHHESGEALLPPNSPAGLKVKSTTPTSTGIINWDIVRYVCFWVVLLAFKLIFGYYLIVSPLVTPTVELVDDYINQVDLVNDKGESFSKVEGLWWMSWLYASECYPFLATAYYLCARWYPHFLVFIIDMAIFFAIWSSMVGGSIALIERQGAVRDTASLRDHFIRAPMCFCQKMLPTSSKISVNLKTHVSTLNLHNLIAANEKSKYKLLSGGGISTGGLSMQPNYGAVNASSSENSNKSGVAANDLMKNTRENSITSFRGIGKSSSSNRLSISSLGFGTGFLSNSNSNSTGSVSELGRASPSESRQLQVDVISYLGDIRNQRWIAFAQVWNTLVSKLREHDHISDELVGIYSCSYFEWLSKPVYLPLFQTVESVEKAINRFKDALTAYSSVGGTVLGMSNASATFNGIYELESQRMEVVSEYLRDFRLNVTHAEAVGELAEIVNWIIGDIINPPFSRQPTPAPAQDTEKYRKFKECLQSLCGNNNHSIPLTSLFDILTDPDANASTNHTIPASLIGVIYNHVVSIVSTLKSNVLKRKPVVSEDMWNAHVHYISSIQSSRSVASTEGVVVNKVTVLSKGNANVHSNNSSASNLRRSTSRSFLQGLNSEECAGTSTRAALPNQKSNSNGKLTHANTNGFNSICHSQLTSRQQNSPTLPPHPPLPAPAPVPVAPPSDYLRDKLREEIRSLFNTVIKAIHRDIDISIDIPSEVQSHHRDSDSPTPVSWLHTSNDIVDLFDFILSDKHGFFWDDMYASRAIDMVLVKSDIKDHYSRGLNKAYGLLKLRQVDVELPAESEARRRITFFINSLFMDIPIPPSLSHSKEYTCMTPYYSEDVLLSQRDLETKNSDGITTILYLQTLHKREWENFLERQGKELQEKPHMIYHPKYVRETRIWASLRAQTLFRTVEGMMQTESALRMLASLESNQENYDRLVKLKFNYVVACQVYGDMRANSDPKANDIEYLLQKYPNLRVAYIDKVRTTDKKRNTTSFSFYSVLVKYDDAMEEEHGGNLDHSSSNDTSPTHTPPRYPNRVNKKLHRNTSFISKQIKEVYRIKLPGNPIIGEGKPENQNHAVIFSRGRYLQAIDMNQDGYFEEALKMRNLLEVFGDSCGTIKCNDPMSGNVSNGIVKNDVAIVGFREHVFTGSVSSVANYMALQELSFVTLGQRVLCSPLKVRQHYGHPDMFNKVFVMTEGGMSKASRGINLSEDIFAGFNASIRGKQIAYKEFLQVGKGRDVGLQQTYKFEAKLAQGNAEQTLSRDMHRLCNRFDFFRLLGFYYGGIAHYMTNTLVMYSLAIVMYINLLLALYHGEGVNGRRIEIASLLTMLLAGMGLLQTMPLAVTLYVEKGVYDCVTQLGYMFLSGGPLYFIFHIQTRCYYFQQTLLAGNAKYRPTGRGFVIVHAKFDENFRFFASSHLYWGVELGAMLIIYWFFSSTIDAELMVGDLDSSVTSAIYRIMINILIYAGETWSLWLVVVAFLLSPFWFNPLSFEPGTLSLDYQQWRQWMADTGGAMEHSWELWWRDENALLWKNLPVSWKCLLLIQKCGMWCLIGFGIAGNELVTNVDAIWYLMESLCLILLLCYHNVLLGRIEMHLSYVTRRVLSMLINTGSVIALICMLYTYPILCKYLISSYYIISAIAFAMLIMGDVTHVMHLYKLHDYLVGHILFGMLMILSMLCQISKIHTSLLYHNALSAGVVMEDVLKFARKSKESESHGTRTGDVSGDGFQLDQNQNQLSATSTPLAVGHSTPTNSSSKLKELTDKLASQEVQLQYLMNVLQSQQRSYSPSVNRPNSSSGNFGEPASGVELVTNASNSAIVNGNAANSTGNVENQEENVVPTVYASEFSFVQPLALPPR